MQAIAWLMLTFLLGVIYSDADKVESTFLSSICQQCNTWCVPDQVATVHQKIGKSGPRGPPGPPGVVNMTALEEFIMKKIDEVLGVRQVTTEIPTPRPIESSPSKTYSGCYCIDLEFAKSRNETGGVFDISIPGQETKEIYCDIETDYGGWIVFQRRMDGSVDFYRCWNDYVAGFGTATGEYWLGLEATYQLTKGGNAEMRIDMVNEDGTRYYAKYSNFRIGSSSDNYRLTVSGYSGNSSDSLNYHKNQQFTTKDRDNDAYAAGQCAHIRSGAWWYNSCVHSNLNGRYGLSGASGIYWRGVSGNIKYIEMKLRRN